MPINYEELTKKHQCFARGKAGNKGTKLDDEGNAVCPETNQLYHDDAESNTVERTK